jgi:hypothetical protein
MNEQDARTALIAMGIVPTRSLIEAYIKSCQAEEAEKVGLASPMAATEPPTAMPHTPAPPQHARGYGKSLLEPVLQEHGTLEKPLGRRKAGRPRVIASWFPAVAQTMADGTSLRTALRINHISLSRSEIRSCYRNTTLRALYIEARRKYFLEHGYGKKPSLRALVGRYV